MNMTDPIADLLTRVRNANKAGLPVATVPYSRFKESVMQVLKEEGFVRSYEVVGEGIKKSLVIAMKYKGKNKERVIEGIVRVSRPGRRVYVGYNDIKPVRQGSGMAILSTPKGIVTDIAAKKLQIGGEWLCSVW